MPIGSTTFYLGGETIVLGRRGGMLHIRMQLFALTSRNAWNDVSFFRISIMRVVEIGRQIEI